MARAALEWSVWWAALLVFQLLLIGQVTWPEVAVAAAGALLAAVVARATRLAAGARLGGTALMGRALLLWPGTLLADTGRLAVAVARGLRGRPPSGRFHTIRWHEGTGPAWTSGLLSATPGLYVVAHGPDRTALVHTLLGGAGVLEKALTTGGRR
ncbi:hypothetical protein [Streptomyces sp. NPDC004267]|uniref:hypothetical protein n=1 Tax=Streptomyces sp. NPDC004267 TaxID=3364694 RepID=UPI003673E4E2